jgi:Na+/proline symporter
VEKVIEVRNKKARVCGTLAMLAYGLGVVILIGTAGYIETVEHFDMEIAIRPIIIALSIIGVGELFRIIEEKNTKELTFAEYMKRRKQGTSNEKRNH